MAVFWPQTVENRAALRTALATLSAVLISFKLHLDTPYWSGMSVVIVSNLYTGSIIDKAMLRIIGTVAGAIIGFYAAGVIANSFLLYFLSCFLIVSVGAYYYSFSVNGYAYLLGALCAFIIISQLAFNPQNAFFVAIWRPVEIGIGVVVSAISAYIIFPNHLKDNVSTQIDTIFTDLSLEFNRLFTALEQNKFDATFFIESNLKMKRKIRSAVELIGAMNHELGVTQERTDEIRALLNSFYDLARQFHYLLILAPQSTELALIRSLSIESVSQAVQSDLCMLKQSFAKQSVEIVTLQITDALADLEKQFNQKHSADFDKSEFIYSFLHFLEQVAQELVLMQSLVTRTKILITPKFEILKTQDRLRTDPDLIKRSIKAGLSVILALGFWLTSNWPGGLNGIISSLIISIRKNLFEMKNVSIHRMLGCFLGGGVSLMSLSLMKMDFYDFVIILFVCVWMFSYFMFKSPKYAYIGLQANIALIISLAQEGGPPIDLAPPLQRLGGVVIGIVASFLVANFIWRSDVWTMLNKYLNKLYTYMTYNLKEILILSKEQKVLHELANLFWLSRGLLESLENEPLSSKRKHLLTELTQRFENLVIMQATISHILITIDKKRVHCIAQSLNIDISMYEQHVVQCFQHHDVAGSFELSNQLINLLHIVEKNTNISPMKNEDLRMFLAYVNALNQLTLHIH